MGRDIQLSALYSPSPAPSIPCFNGVSICSIGAPWLLPGIAVAVPVIEAAPHWQMESGRVWRLLLATAASRPEVHLHCQTSSCMGHPWPRLAAFQQGSSVEQDEPGPGSVRNIYLHGVTPDTISAARRAVTAPEDTGIQDRLARQAQLTVALTCLLPFKHCSRSGWTRL